MTKILYIPNGLYINFLSQTTGGYTVYYESSFWYKVWEDTPEQVIAQFCNPANEHETKIEMGIPVGVELNKEEFEIITDD